MSTNREYASDLLDGFDILKERCDLSMKALLELRSLLKRISKVDLEHSNKIRELIQKQGDPLLEYPHFDGSVRTAFAAIHTAMSDVAQAGDDFYKRIHDDLSLKMEAFVKEMEVKKKKLISDATKVTKEWEKQKNELRKAMEAYHSKQRAAAEEKDSFARAKQEGIVKPGQITKLAQKAEKARQAAEKAEEEYRRVLKLTNQKQAMHYGQEQPRVLQLFQSFDEERIAKTKEFMNEYCVSFLYKPPTFQTAVETMMRAIDQVTSQGDIDFFCTEFGTKKGIPEDMQFMEAAVGVDVSVTPSADTGDAPALPAKSSSGGLGSSLLGNMRKSRSKNDGGDKSPRAARYKPPTQRNALLDRTFGLSAEQESLSDNEKRAVLDAQLSELNTGIDAEQKALDGLERLSSHYGDDKAAKERADGELNDKKATVQQLESFRSQVQSELAALGGAAAAADGGAEPTLYRVEALYDYEATAEGELPMKVGEQFDVKGEDDGWLLVYGSDGTNGYVPSTFIQKI